MKALCMTVMMMFNLALACGANPCRTPLNNRDTLLVPRGKNIIYYVENSSADNKQFLIPFIESELSKMTDVRDSAKRKLFENVRSINYLIAGKQTYKKFISTITIFNRNQLDLSSGAKEKQQNSDIVDMLKKSHYFLKININTLNNLLEYQFILFEIDSTAKHEYNLVKAQNYRVASVFVDPTQPDYKYKIRNTLRQIISEANELPIPGLIYNRIKQVNTINAKKGDISLTGDASDADSPDDQLTYDWKLYSAPPNDTTAPLPLFHVKGKQFGSKIEQSGNYTLILTVNDGFHSKSQTYSLRIKDKPLTEISTSTTELVEYYDKTYHLYSYHNSYHAGDFMGLYDFFVKDLPEGSNWSLLIPEVKILTSSHTISNVSFTSIRYNKVDEDSISNYKQRPIPSTSEAIANWNAEDELNPYKLALSKIEVFSPEKNYNPPIYVHTYQVFQNITATKYTRLPVTRILKVTTTDPDNASNYSSESFKIQFHKINRISPMLSTSMLAGIGKLNGKSVNMLTAGVGCEIYIVPPLSFQGILGIMIPSLGDQSVNYHNSFYYKGSIYTNILNFKNRLIFNFTITDFYRATYVLDKSNLVVLNYNSRFGIGASMSTGLSHILGSNYDFFYSYYPARQLDNLGSFYEIGVSFKFL